MAEIADILTTLLERTRQDKVGWQTTAEESTFVAVLGKASISIQATNYQETIILRILNQEGIQIESMVGVGRFAETTEEQDEQLKELYSKARRIALGVDSQLEDLLKELQAGS